MDFFKNALSGDGKEQGQGGDGNGGGKEGGGGGGKGGSEGFLGGIGDKLNSAAGGGKESEKNEDLLDKGMGYVYLCVFDLGLRNAVFFSALPALPAMSVGFA